MVSITSLLILVLLPILLPTSAAKVYQVMPQFPEITFQTDDSPPDGVDEGKWSHEQVRKDHKCHLFFFMLTILFTLQTLIHLSDALNDGTLSFETSHSYVKSIPSLSSFLSPPTPSYIFLLSLLTQINPLVTTETALVKHLSDAHMTTFQTTMIRYPEVIRALERLIPEPSDSDSVPKTYCALSPGFVSFLDMVAFSQVLLSSGAKGVIELLSVSELVTSSALLATLNRNLNPFGVEIRYTTFTNVDAVKGRAGTCDFMAVNANKIYNGKEESDVRFLNSRILKMLKEDGAKVRIGDEEERKEECCRRGGVSIIPFCLLTDTK